MSALTYSREHLASAKPTARTARKPIWRRVYDTFVESQQRRAEREVARYLANHGGLLTDEMEREIMQRLAGIGRRTL